MLFSTMYYDVFVPVSLLESLLVRARGGCGGDTMIELIILSQNVYGTEESGQRTVASFSQSVLRSPSQPNYFKCTNICSGSCT